jgi:hypothetical protein
MHSKKEKVVYISASISLIGIAVLACRPVIAIGWEEFLLLFVFVAFLLGPPLYRFIRRIQNLMRGDQKDK